VVVPAQCVRLAGVCAARAVAGRGVLHKVDVALEAGAEDVREDGSNFEVITAPEDFEAVKEAIDAAGIPCIDAEVTMLPQNTTSLEGKQAEQMIRLMDMLDNCDDVQKVYTNADIPDDMIDA
jgi:transcriptional/translational regulatory protein YebC/TACO1